MFNVIQNKLWTHSRMIIHYLGIKFMLLCFNNNIILLLTDNLHDKITHLCLLNFPFLRIPKLISRSFGTLMLEDIEDKISGIIFRLYCIKDDYKVYTTHVNIISLMILQGSLF